MGTLTHISLSACQESCNVRESHALGIWRHITIPSTQFSIKQQGPTNSEGRSRASVMYGGRVTEEDLITEEISSKALGQKESFPILKYSDKYFSNSCSTTVTGLECENMVDCSGESCA